MMHTSESTANIYKALIEAAPEIRAIPKSKSGYDYKYATLDSLIEMLRSVLPKHGLWFVQSPTDCDDGITLRTTIIHSSGEYVEDSITFSKTDLTKGKPNDTQKIGAAITYFRRYVLSSLFGVAADEDTDGISQVRQPQPQPAQAKTQTQPQPHPQPQPQPTQAKTQKTQEKKDPVPFIMCEIAKRMKAGATKESILVDFAEILKTDEVRPIENMSAGEQSVLARELYRRQKAK